ncbi:hypothetical protein BJ322DRAFT_1086930 [Thelephora terrestris]|uniref:BTB domain-containing protein n=1 Tax=Thelephora terrestris TaxID=56493 RepID=A0A9P6H744_9AGAM|nr:hypothetical protein BJ322DRAFT_1086930 [Thelephora terrestris]
MDSPPDFLLDALNDSITSGTFIDTKLYVFSRREASGRVSSPKPMYCNSRVLNTVPYFSALFSDRFSEGQARDINEGFPSDAVPHTEYYDYSSDSDLEDDLSCSEDEEKPREDGATKSPLIKDKPELPQCPEGPSSQAPPTSSEDLRQPLQDTNEGEVDHQPSSGLIRMGKVAVIRDMAALTFEAMIYFLYTGKITFAPFSSDSCYGIPAESKPGDWRIPRLPSPSAKSIYRLADKYDIPTLKEQAKAYIYESVTRCDIINEVFSSFSLSFPDILSMQVSQLINKIKAESAGGSESGTRRQLRYKITALSQSQLARATDALAMIWGGVTGLLDLSMPEPESTSCARSTQLSKRQGVVFPPPANWQSMKIALLKSIPTGTFVDTQFYAYNAIGDSLPFDLKPLFISSMVIEEWVPAIESLTVGIESGALPPMDGLTDDYEYWDEELTGVPHKVKPIPKYQIEASTTAESREVAVLGSGAWKTWTSLLSYAYTNKMTFAPLQTSTREGGDPVDNTNMQRQQHCSPRSMYSLTTVLGIEDIREDALKDIRSKLTALNVARELFTSFAAKLVSKKLLRSFLLTLGLLQPFSGHGFRDPVPLQKLHREECQTVDGTHPKNGVWGNTLPPYNLGFGLRQVA